MVLPRRDHDPHAFRYRRQASTPGWERNQTQARREQLAETPSANSGDRPLPTGQMAQPKFIGHIRVEMEALTRAAGSNLLRMTKLRVRRRGR